MLRRFFDIKYSFVVAALILVGAGCKKEDYAVPTPKDVLQNDVIKRSIGPNIVGQQIEFVYAMAILPTKGKLTTATVEASIAGATGTFLEHRSFNTNGSGVDVPVQVGSPSVTSGNTTTVTYNVDTSAAALRYYYVIPEDARGKEVSFTFKSTSSNGETVEYKAGPYKVAKMDMIRNLAISNNNVAYISIQNMAVYNATQAAANADKVDLVYLYRTTPTTSMFNHAFVAPAADPQYLPGVTLPAGVNKTSKIIKVFNLPDYDLARTQVGLYIDDADFEKMDFSTAPNFAINLRAEAGTWVETFDGKYRAYVFINSATASGTAVISIKRYAL